MVSVFGDENAIKVKRRYVSQKTIMKHILSNPFNGLNIENIKSKLPLFTVSQILYHYVRCNAVHNFHFPSVNIVSIMGGGIRYEDNQIITNKVLLETVKNILENMETECLKKNKWPSELRQY